MRVSAIGLAMSLGIFISGCATQPSRRPEFSAGYPVYDCPSQLEGQVKLSADVYPLQDPQAVRSYSLPTVGELGRRLIIGVDPAGLDRRDRIVWSSVSIASFGGTFANWSRVATDNTVIAPGAVDGKADGAKEVVTVKGSAGQIKITRIARGAIDLAGTHTIDLVVMPGGMAIDDMVLGEMRLWEPGGAPLSPAAAQLALSPVRHPPGLDTVQATLQLDFIVRVGASGEEWACSADARVTLVDQDSVRQAFWDLGLAAKNAIRGERLALYNEKVGAIRLTFDSPAAANSFANWLQVTRASAVGDYTIGAFTPKDIRPSRPYGPLDAESMRTYRPLAPTELATLKVGPVGEP
jgi:hypothetical protein